MLGYAAQEDVNKNVGDTPDVCRGLIYRSDEPWASAYTY